MLNIVDAVIIIVFILGILAGMRRGFFRETVFLVGVVLVLIISYKLRVPISTFLYKHLPFFGFKGVFSGVSVLNILIYEIIAFLVVFAILYFLLRVLIKVTGIIEKILKFTIILGFFSKILGGIVGFIEGYIIVFILLFIFNQPFINIGGMEESYLVPRILHNSPVLSDATKNTQKVMDEIDKLSKSYKDKSSKEFNKEAIEVFIKYDIISEENVEYLREKGKLD